jgi:hypothetical protein
MDVPFRALWPFLAIAFGIVWAVLAVLLGFPEEVKRLFGPVNAHHPLFILAVYAPAIAAMAAVGAHGGMTALKRLLSRLLLWRAPVNWWLYLLFAVPLIHVLAAILKGTLPVTWIMLDASASPAEIGFMLVLGPMEELGWRGVALPLLQRRLAPFWAGLILGLIWGLWHLPAFFVSGTPQSSMDLVPFIAGAAAVSVIMVPLFNASRGSILLPALMHFQLNNPLWPDARPLDMLAFVLVAIVVTWANRTTMFRRGAGLASVAV